jgi:hypothetical protein
MTYPGEKIWSLDEESGSYTTESLPGVYIGMAIGLDGWTVYGPEAGEPRTFESIETATWYANSLPAAQRNWIVYGQENHPDRFITDEIFGPYTEAEAEAEAGRLESSPLNFNHGHKLYYYYAKELSK